MKFLTLAERINAENKHRRPWYAGMPIWWTRSQVARYRRQRRLAIKRRAS